MKINVGIVGYGNLGKAVERAVLSCKDFHLVAIFSRRGVTSAYNSKVEAIENHVLYKNKIDVMLLCGGSKSDLELQTPEFAKHFNVINTFDTHKKIPSEYLKIDKICRQNGTIAVLSCGWDPGLFSIMRALMFAVSGKEPYTFWGRGVSMGHSDAIRRVNGVEDAVQFTVPNKDAVKLAKVNKLSNDIPLHFRECYVVAPKTKQKNIEADIKNIPNYFLGQPTTVNFVSNEELIKLKSKMYHKGQVINAFSNISGSKNKMAFEVSMTSNPDFTASVMTAYIFAVKNLMERGSFGAFTMLDIPISFLFYEKDKVDIIKKFV